MAKKATDLIEQALAHSLMALFDHYSPTPVHVDKLDDDQTIQWLTEQTADISTTKKMVSSSIGIGGDNFRASVGLLANTRASQSLFDSDDVCPVDWTGELSNQLGGRVKNFLSRYGVKATMSLPVSIQGVAMGFNFSSTNQEVFAVTTVAGRIICVLNTEVAPDLEWEHTGEFTAAAEGSVCLFES